MSQSTGRARVALRILAIMTVVMIGGTRVSLAQNSRGIGPFASLFGMGPTARNMQWLDFRASSFGVWQNIRFPASFDPTGLDLDPAATTNGTFGGVTGVLAYTFARRSTHSTISVNALGWASDYSVDASQPRYSGDATAGLAQIIPLTRRVALRTGAFVSYLPFYNFWGSTFLPSASQIGAAPSFDPIAQSTSLVTPGVGLPGVNLSSVSASATAGISNGLTRRSSIAADVMVSQIYFPKYSAGNSTQLTSMVTYSNRIWRRLVFDAVYSRTEARLAREGRWLQPIQTFNIALNYDDGSTFRLSRRTTLAVNASLGSFRAVPGSTQYRVLGNATLTHTIGRTWQANASVVRSLGFMAPFQQPVLYDTAYATLSGQLFRRMVWTTLGGWSRGQVAGQSQPPTKTAQAASMLSFALTRRIQVFGQYAYYTNRVPADLTALSTITNFDRQIATVGLSFFQPIIHSMRSQ